MSWGTDDGLHEGDLLPEFSDGQRGLGTTGHGIPADQVAVGAEYLGTGPIADDGYILRPAAEVVGWRIICDCRQADGERFSLLPLEQRWTSDLLVRVPSKALEDVTGGKIYAPDDEVPYVNADEALSRIIQHRWWHEHAAGTQALAAVRQAHVHLEAAQKALDAAVRAARESRQSWEAIGAASGMTRQSAHQRWSPKG